MRILKHFHFLKIFSIIDSSSSLYYHGNLHFVKMIFFQIRYEEIEILYSKNHSELINQQHFSLKFLTTQSFYKQGLIQKIFKIIYMIRFKYRMCYHNFNKANIRQSFVCLIINQSDVIA